MTPRVMNSGAQSGFTLLEALVALAIVAMVVLGFLGLRTAALMDAAEARNWRLARELAEEKMSELRAGARELPPESGTEIDFEDYPGFSYQILIGEGAVAEADAALAGDLGSGNDEYSDRVTWQQDRDRYRRASQKGMTYREYQDWLWEEENRLLEEEKAPSDTEFEEVAVVVYFPKVRLDEEGEDAFVLKARISTLAISGLTPDQAQAQAEARGLTAETGTGSGSPFGGDSGQ